MPIPPNNINAAVEISIYHWDRRRDMAHFPKSYCRHYDECDGPLPRRFENVVFVVIYGLLIHR
jgi:hypothetical protein